MKDNINLIRKLLKIANAVTYPQTIYHINGYLNKTLFYSCNKLIDENLIEGAIEQRGEVPYSVTITGITDKGKEYLEVLKKKRSFKKVVLNILDKSGEITIEIIFEILANL